METARLTVGRLGVHDLGPLVRYLEHDRRNNLFLLANLDQLGMEHPALRYFCAKDAQGAWAGVLMLLRSTAGLCWRDRRALPSLKDIFLREQASALSGQQSQVDPFLNLLPDAAIGERLAATYATVSSTGLRAWSEQGERLATLDDLDLLADLYTRNLLFGRLDRDRRRARIESILTTGGVITLVERNGLAVSAARTSAVGFGMAMIGGVLTLPAYRQQGLARACVGLMSRRLIELGIEPCLLYNERDPAASRTYLGLGYQFIDWWTVAFLDS
jgi:GNAT superfamily N-acetyltransferase